MKKLVSLLLALCLVFALGASAFAANFPANGFSDVSRSAWYAEAVDFVKAKGGKTIKFMCLIAAPEGLKKLHEAHPDVQIYVGNLDRELNDNAYICPGLGDAGDRIFGTK